jgi:hemerythrin-like domain-containing protein
VEIANGSSHPEVTRMRHHEPSPILETQLVHDVHRRATALLADAALTRARRRTPEIAAALRELRNFTVALLDHHHESEDHGLWPILVAAAPALASALAELSEEHAQLTDDLAALAAVRIDAETDDDLISSRARAVRDHVHEHLHHEEPVLFPALRDHVSEPVWHAFSQHTVATAPQEGLHLLSALFDELGTSRQIEVILQHVPADRRAPFRASAARGRATLDVLGDRAPARTVPR